MSGERMVEGYIGGVWRGASIGGVKTKQEKTAPTHSPPSIEEIAINIIK